MAKNKRFREIRIILSLCVLFSVLVLGIYFGINSSRFSFDTTNEAAGRTVFLENGQDLQAAIDNAGPSDAIFLKPGSFTTPNGGSIEIRNKNIRILGSGVGQSIIEGVNSEKVIKVINSKVSIEGLTVSGSRQIGIDVDSGSQTEVQIRDVNITRNAGVGINTFGKTIVQRSIIDQNGSGIISHGDITVENSIIKNNVEFGLVVYGRSNSDNSNDSTVTNSIFKSNRKTQILISGGRRHTIKNVTVYDGESGIVTSAGSSNSTPSNEFSVTVSNSIIQKHQAKGVLLVGQNSSITYSNVFDNNQNYSDASLSNSPGNLSVDSGFASTEDLKLAANSPLRDKGTPSEKDADGSTIDIGAYGGRPILPSSNTPPTITSRPIEYIKPGQKFEYEVVASDPDGDSLTYVVLNNNLPSWLQREGNKFVGTPGSRDVGYYGVVVVVSDRKGGNVVQAFTINVLPEGRSIPVAGGTSTTPTQTTSTPKTSTTPSNQTKSAPKVLIISPKAGDVLSPENNEIKWSVTQGAEIDNYLLTYSSNGQDFVTITRLPGSVSSYKWEDIGNLTPGKYFVRVEATDKGTPPVKVAATSEQFEIKIETKPSSDSITITKNSPADNDVVRDVRQQIVVEFKPEVEIDKSKSYLKVNGSEVAYSTTINTIFYQPPVPYEGNKVEVEVSLVTTKGAKASKQWIFNIQREAKPNDTRPDTETKSRICIPGTPLCVPQIVGAIILGLIILIIFLLILYFTAKLIKEIRDKREGSLEAEFTDYYGGDTSSQSIGIDQGAPGPYPSTDSSATSQNDQGYYAQDLSQYYNVSQPEEYNSQTQQENSTNVSDPTQSNLANPVATDNTGYTNSQYGQANYQSDAQYLASNDANNYQDQRVVESSQYPSQQDIYTSNQEPHSVTQEGVYVDTSIPYTSQQTSQQSPNETSYTTYPNTQEETQTYQADSPYPEGSTLYPQNQEPGVATEQFNSSGYTSGVSDGSITDPTQYPSNQSPQTAAYHTATGQINNDEDVLNALKQKYGINDPSGDNTYTSNPTHPPKQPN